MKIIKILGTGCTKCKLLEAVVQQAVEKTGVEAKIIKVTDIQEIMKYNIMSTPGLVIDEKLVSTGKVLDINEMTALLSSTTACCSGNQDSTEGCCSDKKDNTTGCCSDKESCNVDCAPTKESTKTSCGCN